MASLPTTSSSHLSASVDVNSAPFMSDTKELSSYLHDRVQEISKRFCGRHCSWNTSIMNRKTEMETGSALRFLTECEMSSALIGTKESTAKDLRNIIQINDNHNPSTELDLETYMLAQNPWKKAMEGSAMKIDPGVAEDKSAMVNINSSALSCRFNGDCKEQKNMCEFRYYTECYDLKQNQSLSLVSDKLGQNSSTQVIIKLQPQDQKLLSDRELMEISPSSLAARVSRSAVRKLMMDPHDVQLQTDRADEDIMFTNSAVHSAISSKLSELEEMKKAFIITAQDDRNLFHPTQIINLRMPSLQDHICSTSSDTSHHDLLSEQRDPLSTQMKQLVQPAQVIIPCLNLSSSSNCNVHQEFVFTHRDNGKKQNQSVLNPSPEKNCHEYLRASVSSVDSSECDNMHLNLAQSEKYSLAMAENSSLKASGEAMDGQIHTATDIMDGCKKAYQEVVADCEGINNNTDGTDLGFNSERMDGLDLLLHAVEIISDQKDCPRRLKKKKKLWTSMEPVLSSSENLIPKRRKPFIKYVYNGDLSDRIPERNLSARSSSAPLIDVPEECIRDPSIRDDDDECIRERKMDQLCCNNNGSSHRIDSMARFPVVRKRSLRFPNTNLTKEPHTVVRFKSLQDVSDAEFPWKKGSLVSERSTDEEDLILMQRSRKHGFDEDINYMERSHKDGFDEEEEEEEEEITLQRSNKQGLILTWKMGKKTDKEEQMYDRERGVTSDHNLKKKQKQKNNIKKKKSISKLQASGYDYKMGLKGTECIGKYSLHGLRQLYGIDYQKASAIMYNNVAEMENIMEMKSEGRDGDGEISLVSNSIKRGRSHALPVKFSDSVLQSWKKKERRIKENH